MKVGDLVRPGETHFLRHADFRAFGVVVTHLPARPSVSKEAVEVQWNDGEIELEVPAWLEVVSD